MTDPEILAQALFLPDTSVFDMVTHWCPPEMIGRRIFTTGDDGVTCGWCGGLITGVTMWQVYVNSPELVRHLRGQHLIAALTRRAEYHRGRRP